MYYSDISIIIVPTLKVSFICGAQCMLQTLIETHNIPARWVHVIVCVLQTGKLRQR